MLNVIFELLFITDVLLFETVVGCGVVLKSKFVIVLVPEVLNNWVGLVKELLVGRNE